MGFEYCRVLWYPQYAGVVAARCGHGTAAAWGAIYVEGKRPLLRRTGRLGACELASDI